MKATPDLSRRNVVHFAALKAIGFLIEHDSFWEGTKRQFAYAMGWYMPNGKDADLRLVQDVCRHTRDQADLADHYQTDLGGMVIAYAPIRGGMTLIDPSDGSNLELEHYIHLLRGDVTRQQQHKTENRGRLAMWQALTTASFVAGYQNLARICAQAESQIKETGFVSDGIHDSFMKELKLLGFMK